MTTRVRRLEPGGTRAHAGLADDLAAPELLACHATGVREAQPHAAHDRLAHGDGRQSVCAGRQERELVADEAERLAVVTQGARGGGACHALRPPKGLTGSFGRRWTLAVSAGSVGVSSPDRGMGEPVVPPWAPSFFARQGEAR
jgi:hypothetical protein